MRKYVVVAAVFAAIAVSAISVSPAASTDAPTIVRKILLQEDAPGGNTLSMVQVTIPVGGREGKHTHPGPLIVHVLSDAFSLYYEGKPTTTYKEGDTFYVEPGKVHEGINNGTVPAVGIAAFVTPKGVPLTKQISSD